MRGWVAYQLVLIMRLPVLFAHTQHHEPHGVGNAFNHRHTFGIRVRLDGCGSLVPFRRGVTFGCLFLRAFGIASVSAMVSGEAPTLLATMTGPWVEVVR